MKKLIVVAIISITPILTASAASASAVAQDVQTESLRDGAYTAAYARLQSFSASSLTFTAIDGVTASGSGTILKDRLYGAVDPETGLRYGYNYRFDTYGTLIREAIEAQWAPGAVMPPLGTNLSDKVVSISGYTVGATKTRIDEICTDGPIISWGWVNPGPKCHLKTVTWKTATLYVTALTVIKDSTCQESNTKKVDLPWRLESYSIRTTSCVAGSSVFVKGPAYGQISVTNTPPSTISYPLVVGRRVVDIPVSVQSISYVISAGKTHNVRVGAGRWSKASFTLPARFDVGVKVSYDVLDDGKPALEASLGRFSR